MAEQDRIDLLKELSQTQKDSDYAFLTTFNFDPFFFDAYLFAKLERNNPAAQFAVLMDAQKYQESFAKFTAQTGTKYRLCPIYLNQGVFHPKIFLFISQASNRATLYVCSSNLTLHGFTHNAELVSKIDYAETDKQIGRNLKTAIEIFYGLRTRSLIRDDSISKLLDDAQLLSWIKEKPVNDEPQSLIHNLDRPVLDQMLELVTSRDFDEIIMMAPFYSAEAKVLERLLSVIRTKRLTLCLQRHNHNLSSLEPYRSVCKKHGVILEEREVSFQNESEGNRKIHSKIIYFKGARNFLLVGSPNITEYALLQTANEGNFETAMLFRDIDADTIISQIKPKPIPDIQMLLAQRANSMTQGQNFMPVFSADFDAHKKIVRIVSNPLEGSYEVYIETRDPKGTMKTIGTFGSTGILDIRITDGIPTEVSICRDDVILARRRIFYEDELLKRVARSRASAKEIIERLRANPQIAKDEVFKLLLAIMNPRQTRENATETQEKPEPVNSDSNMLQRTPSPAREKNLRASRSLIHKVAELYDSYLRNAANLRDAEKVSQEELESDGTNSSKSRSRMMDTWSEAKADKLMSDTINLASIILRDRFVETEDSEDGENIAQAQIIFITFYLKFFRTISSSRRVFESAKSTIQENLAEVTKDELSKETRIDLFRNLLCLSFALDDSGFFRVAKRVFNFEELIQKETFNEITKQVIPFLAETPLSQELNDSIICNRYAYLLSYCLTSGNVDAFLKETYSRFQIEQNEDSHYKVMLNTIFIYAAKRFESLVKKMLGTSSSAVFQGQNLVKA